jgi:tRNA dimethylallyltransferase
MFSRKVIFVVGPTAVGKTDVGLFLAEKLNAEIVSCDSMQVYKELSIITAKPSLDCRKIVKHHLFDIISVEQEFDVNTFNELARSVINEIHKRKKIPIFIGGSGLYMKILLDGIFKCDNNDPLVREKLKQRAKAEGNDALYEELKAADAQAAKKIHLNDTRRIIRALEIYHTTRRPISILQKEQEGLWEHYDVKIFGLNAERKKLYENINKRVDTMFDNGAVEEVRNLDGLALSKTAQVIIGIKEIKGHLDGGVSLDNVKDKIKQNTRRFAKRQMTWLRKEKRIDWIEVKKGEVPEDVAHKILDFLKH